LAEGSIRTFCFIRWPGHVKPDTSSYAIFSIMDFLPTFASIVGGKVPTDRPIDGVDQTDVLLGNSVTGHRESLLTFIGGDMVAARWKQWRIYFTDISSDWNRPAATARHFLGQRSDGRLPEGLQHRDGPARGSRGWRTLWLGGGTRAQSG
jgi:hypothetical protein